jgi:hypothetical protein
MCPSTESADAQSVFAADVLRNLLHYIEVQNQVVGHHPFPISHAWTDGPIMYWCTQPHHQTGHGDLRDTRESIIDPSPWPDLDEAVLYYYLLDYYLLDFEENQPYLSFRRPGEPETSGGSDFHVRACRNIRRTSPMPTGTRRRGHLSWQSPSRLCHGP